MTVATAPEAARAETARPSETILKVDGLRVELRGERGTLRAVDGVSFDLKRGETLGIVGESGCGKSLTALSVIGLLPRPVGRIASGTIELEGVGNLARLPDSLMKRVRGNHISMIFQEPMTSLNPVFTVGFQISEVLRTHKGLSKREARARSIEMLKLVGIPLPEMRFDSYPHQLSGGMRQRVMIAMALACEPQIMLADEPTTALDVTIQAQILKLMNQLKEKTGTSIVLITHDLGVIAKMAARILVMYAGVVVEESDARDLFATPLHPYTQGLLNSILRLEPGKERRRQLYTIKGSVPSLYALPRGCRFSDRCPAVHEPCRVAEPPLAPPDADPSSPHKVRCWLHRKPDLQ
ncbi:MAG: ABC transporter ATP-binding protein [Rhizobiaceae bacterium]|nr:ABC transporter ATP-binding protein [Rhizobiaceae bacterium]